MPQEYESLAGVVADIVTTQIRMVRESEQAPRTTQCAACTHYVLPETAVVRPWGPNGMPPCLSCAHDVAELYSDLEVRKLRADVDEMKAKMERIEPNVGFLMAHAEV